MSKFIKPKSAILLFVAVCLAVFFAACASDQSDKTQNPSQPAVGDSNEEQISTTEADMFAGIEIAEYAGREFNILARENFAEQFGADEETGDIINDSIYKLAPTRRRGT